MGRTQSPTRVSEKREYRGMSALPPTADVGQIGRDVRFVPERQWRKEKAAPQGDSSIQIR